MGNPELKKAFLGVVKQFKQYLAHQQQLGIIEYINENKQSEEHFMKVNKVSKTISEGAAVNTLKKEPVKNSKKGKFLNDVHNKVKECKLCILHKTRKNVVFGEGNEDADLVFIGEAPGHDEDLQARPFIGAAGKLLTRIIEELGIKRSDVYIANIVKCRPPMNRFPFPKEVEFCMPYLIKQLEIIKPKVICTLGACSTMGLLNMKTSIGSLRGKIIDYNGIKVVPTYHPAFCLRNPSSMKIVYQDIKFIKQLL